MRFEDQRSRLVDELKLCGIKDENVLNAINSIPREKFTLPQYSDYAYRNQPLPIDFNQTISQPLMIAIMLEHLSLNKADIVLEIGTGSGYQTALLASIVEMVCTIERINELSVKARTALKSMNYDNIFFKIGDGSLGWKKIYPPVDSFPKIIVSAASSHIPKKLIEQLADPGILVIPVGSQYIQSLIKIEKKDGDVIQTEHGGCTFVPLITEGD